eukprot:scaffold2437_cov395-Prasinococcus_capsulatus_cf.AAC.17
MNVTVGSRTWNPTRNELLHDSLHEHARSSNLSRRCQPYLLVLILVEGLGPLVNMLKSSSA